jgi:hypothetical protein
MLLAIEAAGPEGLRAAREAAVAYATAVSESAVCHPGKPRWARRATMKGVVAPEIFKSGTRMERKRRKIRDESNSQRFNFPLSSALG